MGALMRQYWIPALPSSEFAEPDGQAKRMRLLGENLVMFRDTRGDIGALAEACPQWGRKPAFRPQPGMRTPLLLSRLGV